MVSYFKNHGKTTMGKAHYGKSTMSNVHHGKTKKGNAHREITSEGGDTYHATSSSKVPMKQFMLPLTSPISRDRPKPEDVRRTEELQRTLETHKIFESELETKHRQEILAKLTNLFKDWIKSIAISKRIPMLTVSKLGGRILTFGSYRLGVHQSGADIDALCVAPYCIERTDYFASFYPLLKMQPEVTECRAVEGAFVPVIKMKYDGIEVDLLFAKLSLKEIPNDLDLSDDNILRNLDERCVRSLNGCRVTDAILDLVPNVDVFRLALRAVKLWAKKNGVYSNALGYFGGVTWAMLVVRICQLYPNAAAATIVHKMFLIFSQWKWPLPMLLTRVDNVADLPFPVWDPRINLGDRSHLMPIITPAYPQQNSTFNVTQSARKIITSELLRALNKTKKIMEGSATWESLFESPSFFCNYRHFVVITASAETAADHMEWSALIESKSRLLIGNLEQAPHVALAHINPKCFNARKNDACVSPNSSIASTSSTLSHGSPSSSKNGSDNELITTAPFSSMWFIGLEFMRSDNMSIDLRNATQSFLSQVNQFAERIKMRKAGMDVNAHYTKRTELNRYLDADILRRDRKPLQPLSSLLAQSRASDNALATELYACKIGEKRPSDDEAYDACRPAKLSKAAQ